MSIQSENIEKLVQRREKARLGGGAKRIDAQHAKGKKTGTWKTYNEEGDVIAEEAFGEFVY